jgi:hypothetical protein
VGQVKIVKRALAIGGAVAAMGALAAPAGAVRPNTWVVSCARNGEVTQAFVHSATQVGPTVRQCVQEGGRPAGVEPGLYVYR